MLFELSDFTTFVELNVTETVVYMSRSEYFFPELLLYQIFLLSDIHRSIIKTRFVSVCLSVCPQQ